MQRPPLLKRVTPVQVEAVSGELRGVINEMQEVVAVLQVKLSNSSALSAEAYTPLSPAAAAVADKWQRRVMQVSQHCSSSSHYHKQPPPPPPQPPLPFNPPPPQPPLTSCLLASHPPSPNCRL